MKTFEMKLRGFGMFSLVAMSALPLFFASCSSDNDPVETESEENELTEIQLASTVLTGSVGEWSANTRATSATYTNVSEAYATINRYDDKTQLYNQKLSYSGTLNLLTGDKAMYYPTDGTNVDIYLYNGNYKIDTNTNEGKVKSGSKFTVSALADQTNENSSNQEKSDFIFGQKLNQQRSVNNVEVTMDHLMSQFALNVTAGTDSNTQALKLRITKITLGKLINTSTYTVGSEIDTLVTKELASDTEIILYNNSDGVALTTWNSDGNKGKSLKAIVLPQNMKGKTLTISTKEVGSETAGKSFTYTFPNTELKKGKKHVYNMTVSAMSLKVTAKVLDWDEQTAVDIEAGYDVPTE
jgi:hypothetical protein